MKLPDYNNPNIYEQAFIREREAMRCSHLRGPSLPALLLLMASRAIVAGAALQPGGVPGRQLQRQPGELVGQGPQEHIWRQAPPQRGHQRRAHLRPGRPLLSVLRCAALRGAAL